MKKLFRIKILLNEDWVLSKRDDDVLPSDYLEEVLKGKYEVSGLKCSLTTLEVSISGDDSDTEDIRNTIEKTLSERYGCKAGDDAFDLQIRPANDDEKKWAEEEKNKAQNNAPAEPEPEPEPAEETAPAPKPEPKQPKKSALERINALTGAAEFKALAEECAKTAAGFKSNNIIDVFRCRTYLISINDGYGLTTYLRLFADLLDELGLFEFAPRRTKVAEIKLGSPESKNENPFGQAISFFNNTSGKVVSFDISEWMSKIYDKEFRNFLKMVFEKSGSNIIFFRVPFVEKNVLHEIRGGINDLLFVKALSVVPFSGEELLECAGSIIGETGFEMSDGAWDIFNARIIEEKNDGRFYGVNTIRKIVNEMLCVKQLSDSIAENFSRLITKEDVSPLLDDSEAVFKSAQEMLDELVGLDGVRERIMEIVAQIEASVKNPGIEAPCIHMRFTGNPGTGKTTVARIVGRLLKEKGILRNGDFFEYSGRDLCGRFVGETSPKTASMCRDSYGSVMFIDEAYTLYRHDGFNSDYGREAIDTLIAEMENHRNDFMIIMAGYPDEMDVLMKSNAGLRSRMPYQIEFPNYSREQLAEMFITMASKNFTFDDKLEAAVKEYFETLSSDIIDAKEFSNARYVRNLFERTWGKAVLRCQMANTDCTVITEEDFRLASSDKEFKSISEGKCKPIGFV